MPQNPIALDDNGNPQYDALDDNGNPILHNEPSKLSESDFETVKVGNNYVSRRKGESTEDAQRRIQSHSLDTNWLGGIPEIFEGLRNRGIDAVANNPYLPEGVKPAAAAMTSLSLEPLRFLAEGASTAEGLLFPSVVKGFRSSNAARIPEVLPPEAPPIRRALPAAQDPIIAGPTGKAVRRSQLTPDVEAYVANESTLAGHPSEPAHFGTDLGELRERNRLKNVFYTGHEQQGGTALELPNRPMPIPAQAGDTSLGFESVSRGPLEYPLNVVPEVVRPRGVQTVARALAGDAEPSIPREPVTFANEEPIPPKPVTEEPDMMGGTKAIQPGEDILPSARREQTPPHVMEQEVPAKPISLMNASPNTIARMEAQGYEVVSREADGSVTMRPKGATKPIEQTIDNYVGKNIEPVFPGARAEVRSVLQRTKDTLTNVANGLITSGEKQLERMGSIGTEIRRALSSVEYTKRELFNKFAGPYMDAVKPLNPDQLDEFVNLMDKGGTSADASIQNALDITRAQTREMASMAEELGVRVKNTKGQKVPFKGLENYWPHRPTAPMASEQFINELMNANPKLSRAAAEKLAAKFKAENEWFNSPQHSRQFGAFPFRRDAGAMVDHIADMADIIARAEHLGPGDIGDPRSIISQLIERAPNRTQALDIVRTHLRGGMDKNNLFYRGMKAINNFSAKVQAFTKLGKFPISNLNNQMQTILHGNLTDFANGLKDSIMGNESIRQLAREYGTVSVGDIPVSILSEAGRGQIPITGPLVKWADDWSRLVATGAGKGVAQTLFKAAKAGNQKALMQLKNLLLKDDVGDILQQNELHPEDLKFATHRFVELAQQLDSKMKLPPAWVNEPLLQIPLIFKKFAYQGTKSVKDAIMMDPARNIPMFLVAAPMFGELTGDLKSVVTGVLRGAPMPDDMIGHIVHQLQNRGDYMNKYKPGFMKTGDEDIDWLVNRLAADYISSWGFGLVADMFQGAMGDKGSLLGTLAGPAVEQGTNILQDIAKGDFKELGREGLRSIPIIGPEMQQRFLPYKSQEFEP